MYVFEGILSNPEIAGNPRRRGRISTLDLLALVSSDWHLLVLKLHFCETAYHNVEINKNTEPFPSVRIPWN